MAREDAAKLLEARALEKDLPLDHMLRVMRDPTVDPHRRDAMAKAAAPYVHPTLAAVAHKHLDAKGRLIAPVINVRVLQPPPESPKLTVKGPEDGEGVRLDELLGAHASHGAAAQSRPMPVLQLHRLASRRRFQASA
jgi:hypothetical protein